MARKMALITIASGKGGVGKTTTALALAGALRELEISSVLVDGDVGASLTASLGFEADGTQAYDLLLSDRPIDEFALESAEGLVFVPGTARLASIGRDQVDALAERLRSLSRERHVIVDTAQSLVLAVTRAAIKAADYLVVPVPPEPKAVERSALDVVAAVKAYGVDPEIFFVATMVMAQLRLTQQQLERIAGLGISLSAIIPRGVAASEADLVHQSVVAYAPRSPVADGYRQLARALVGSFNRSRLAEVAPLRDDEIAIA
jgi:cellulose biosynthesis protein BcsQ